MDQRRAENEFKKSFLRSYRRIKRNVAVLSDQIAELRAAKMGVSCGIGDGMPHAHAGSDLSDYAAKLDELIREMNQERYRLVRVAVLINRAINKVPEGIERYVLTKKYLLGWGWERIADGLGYSVRSVYYIHGRGLHKLQVPEEWKKEAEEAS